MNNVLDLEYTVNVIVMLYEVKVIKFHCCQIDF